MSLSRELVIGLIIFYSFFLKKKYGYIKSIIIVVLVGLFIYFFGRDLVDKVLFTWETKINMSTSAQDLNELSSGRLDLQFLALNQIVNNPLFGTGFQGFSLDYLNYKGYDNLEGWSTHIYFLTVLWKMGFIAFTFFCFFLYRINKIVFKSVSLTKEDKSIYLVFIIALFIINLFWDALLAPNIIILFMFITSLLSFKKSV